MYETDETIGAGIDFLALSVVSQVGDYVNVEHPEAQEFVRECLEDLEGSFHLWLAGMLKSALWSGYAVSEPVYRWDGERVRPYRLELLNPRSLNFATPGDPKARPMASRKADRWLPRGRCSLREAPPWGCKSGPRRGMSQRAARKATPRTSTRGARVARPAAVKSW